MPKETLNKPVTVDKSEDKPRSQQRMVSRVELAILANGGGDYDEKACECDASVNQAPCRYCAIRDALNETLRYLRAQAANAEVSGGATDATPATKSAMRRPSALTC